MPEVKIAHVVSVSSEDKVSSLILQSPRCYTTTGRHGIRVRDWMLDLCTQGLLDHVRLSTRVGPPNSSLFVESVYVSVTSVKFSRASSFLDTWILYECLVSPFPPFHDYQKISQLNVRHAFQASYPCTILPNFPKLDMHSSIQVSRKLDSRTQLECQN